MDQSEDEEPKGREAALPGVGGVVVPAMDPKRSVIPKRAACPNPKFQL